jgi:hypothetical protein
MDAADREPDSTADGDGARWMSFAELGAARGISKASAIKLVRRHGWRRQRDNQGHVRALVPLTWAQDDRDGEGDNLGDSTADNPPDNGLMAGALAALEDAVAGLRGQLDVANARVDEESARADRADAALTGERVRADALRERLDDVQRDLKASEAIASELRGDLDAARAQAQAAQEVADAQARLMAARRSRGLLARLRAAVSGR